MKEMTLRDGRELTVRPAQPEDAQELIDFLNNVGGESDFLLFGANECAFTPEQERAFIENVNRDTAGKMLVGFAQAEAAGIATLTVPQRSRIAHTGELSIAVRKKFEGQGVGSALIGELLRFARESGLRVVYLGVNAENERAIALYKRFGFEESGRHPQFFHIGGRFVDELLMHLTLT